MTEVNLSNLNTGVAEAPKSIEASWFYADGVPGQGDRPDYLETKYKSVAEQAKGYKEAQKLLGVQAAAPEQYDFSEVLDHIDQDNPVIKEFSIYAKEHRISQDTFAKSLKTFVEYDRSRQPNVDAEIAKLGADGAQKVTTIQNWIKNNLSADSVKALEKLPVRAEVISMLDELRQLHVHSAAKVPGSATSQTDFSVLTVGEVEAEMMQNYTRYNTDPGYRAKITKMFEQAVG